MPFLVAVAAMAMAMVATASRPSGGDVPCAPTADISSITHGFNMSGKARVAVVAVSLSLCPCLLSCSTG